MVCQYFVLEAGKAFVKKKGKLTEKDLKAENNLPTSKFAKDIPKFKDLTKNGLPSMSSIMKFYENWKEPFFIYKKIYDEANRNKH
ncbi:hypothetical protein SAMN05216540_1238 [Butyrivibrio sp. M55]|nr:hypothetical protein SAMN05216540_1238 [Butyrivibrio sp. M55]